MTIHQQNMQDLIKKIDNQLELIRLKRKSIKVSMQGHTIPKYDLHKEEEYTVALRKSEHAVSDLNKLDIEEKTLHWIKNQIDALSQNSNDVAAEKKLFKSGMTDVEFMSVVALAMNDLNVKGVPITQAAVIRRLGCAKQTFQKRFNGNDFYKYVSFVLDDKGYVSFSVKKEGT